MFKQWEKMQNMKILKIVLCLQVEQVDTAGTVEDWK